MSASRSLLILALFLAVSAVISFFMGRFSATPGQFLEILSAALAGRKPDVPRDVEMVFAYIRVPRVIVAVIAGAGLSAAGCAYQGVFRNPMVSPDILGATAGAGFGASLAILWGFNNLGVQVAAFFGGLFAALLAYGVGSAVSSRGNTILPLVLSGIVVSALFRSGVSMIKTTADPFNKLPAITFWLLGSFSAVRVADIPRVLAPVILGVIPLILTGTSLSILSFGDEEAATLGINPPRLRFIVIICSTVITSAVVSIGGLIEWVGLVIPHLARMILGPNFRVLIPGSLLLGGAFLLLVDDLARSLLASEISLGILTSLLGAPFFLYLMFRQKLEANKSFE
jgi:iron complex transport system permease protein